MGDLRLPFFAAVFGALDQIPAVCTLPDLDEDGVDAISVERCFQALPPEEQALCEPARDAFRELMHMQANLRAAAARLTDELSPIVKPLALEALGESLRKVPATMLCMIVATDRATVGGDLSDLADVLDHR